MPRTALSRKHEQLPLACIFTRAAYGFLLPLDDKTSRQSTSIPTSFSSSLLCSLSPLHNRQPCQSLPLQNYPNTTNQQRYCILVKTVLLSFFLLQHDNTPLTQRHSYTTPVYTTQKHLQHHLSHPRHGSNRHPQTHEQRLSQGHSRRRPSARAA